MEYLLIPLLGVLAASKSVVQSRFAKGHTKTTANGVFFVAFVFLTCALLTIPSLFQGSVNGKFLLLSAIYGVTCLLFQFAYLQAFRYGSTPVSVLIATTAMVGPVVFSAIAYGEPFGAKEIIGLILILSTFVLNTQFKQDGEKKKTGLLWIVFISLTFLGNAGAMIVQKIFVKQMGAANTPTFVCYSYLIGTVLAFPLAFLLRHNSKEEKEPVKKPLLIAAFAVGAMLCVFQIVNNYALSKISATILIPTYNCITSLFVALATALLFKEKMTKKQILSAVLSVGAILLMVL